MKRMKLDPEELLVESFEASSGASGRGTVRAREFTQEGEATCPASCDPPLCTNVMTYCIACSPESTYCEPDTGFSLIDTCAFTCGGPQGCAPTQREAQTCMVATCQAPCH